MELNEYLSIDDSPSDRKKRNKYALKRVIPAQRLLRNHKMSSTVRNSESNGSKYRIHEAVRSTSIEDLHICLESPNVKGDVNVVDEEGMTPLHYAAKIGRTNIAMLLIENGAPVNLNTRHGTPWQVAMRYCKGETALEILQCGADLNFTNLEGMTALHLAVDGSFTEIVSWLLSTSKVDVNVQDLKMNTPLHYATVNDDVATCTALIDNGALVDAVNSNGETALHLAAAENNLEVAYTLLNMNFKESSVDKKVFIDVARNDKKTALLLSVQKGNADITKLLIKHGADMHAVTNENKSLLHLAASSGNVELMKLLLSNDVTDYIEDRLGRTPLHEAIEAGNKEIVAILLEAKCPVNTGDRKGTTPLLLAVEKNNFTMVKILLDKGAIPSVQDNQLKTGLHYASANGNLEIVSLLVDRCKSLIRKKDEDSRSPLHYAADNGFQKIIKCLANKTSLINEFDNFGETALHVAARRGNAECVKVLGSDKDPLTLNARNFEGQTPLHLAAIHNHPAVCLALLQSNAAVEPIDKNSWSPLQYAASKDHDEILKILFQFNPNINYTDEWGNTALMIAAEAGKTAAVNFLLCQSETDLRITNQEGDNFFDLALDFQRETVCKAILESDRWREALSSKDHHGQHFMQKLIKRYPNIAEIILDRSTSFSDHHVEHPDFVVTFDYQFLEEPPGNKSILASTVKLLQGQRKELHFAPNIMWKTGQKRLMGHPLVSSLMSLKWTRLCRYFYYLRFLVYLVFIVSLNTLTFLELYWHNQGNEKKLPSQNAYGALLIIIIFLFAVFQLFNEIFKLFCYRWKYFCIFENYLELAMYIITIWYIMAFLICESFKDKLVAVPAIVCICLAWVNYLLYLQALPVYNIYMVMFIQVCKTIFKLLFIFGIIFLAFGLVFYLLAIGNPAFKSPDDIAVKMVVMAIGELDASDWLFGQRNKTEDGVKKLNHPELSYAAFVLFLLIVTIAFMNLLLGLAVGDISDIRASATSLIFKQQLQLVESIQRIVPNCVLRKYVFKPTWSYAINKQSRLQTLFKELASDTFDADLKMLRTAQLDFEADRTATA